MEAHRRSPIGARLVDGAIVLLSAALVAWVAVIAAAQIPRIGNGGGGGAGETPSPTAPAELAHGWDQRAGWKLVWHDEFNQATCPSTAKWRFEHGFVRNAELQWYQPQNAYCQDGVLVLEARREEKRNPDYQPGSPHWKLNTPSASYTSASIASKYHFTHGHVEALIRIDPRLGSWPAFWTLGDGYRHSIDSWPATGEVDIMEYYRGIVLANVCNPKASWCGWSSTRQSLARLGGQAWANRFHVWAMDWNARWIDLYLDGKRVNRFATADAARRWRKSPYIDRPAFLLFSQAIGGVHGGDPAGTEFPVRLEVGYVRVYQRAREDGRLN